MSIFFKSFPIGILTANPSLFRYVSRYHVKDSSRHVVLGTQQFKPNEFASQINLSMENAWGILRCVIDICRKLEEGKYLILKDPNKARRKLCWVSSLLHCRIEIFDILQPSRKLQIYSRSSFVLFIYKTHLSILYYEQTLSRKIKYTV